MKVITEYGIQEITQRRVFIFNNHLFTLCEVPVKSLNGKELTRCVHYYSGKILPITFNKESTLKAYTEESKRKLRLFQDNFGEKTFKNELNRFKIINTEMSAKWKIQ